MVTREEAVAVIEGERLIPTCRHHWVIEAANGPVSTGQCRNCHEVREFFNSIFEPERED